jgi:hypothetical protein
MVVESDKIIFKKLTEIYSVNMLGFVDSINGINAIKAIALHLHSCVDAVPDVNDVLTLTMYLTAAESRVL